MSEEQEAKVARLMVELYLNTQAAIEKFAVKDMLNAELATYNVENIARRLRELAQQIQEMDKDA